MNLAPALGLAALLAVSPVLAAGADEFRTPVPIKSGTPYEVARGTLLRANARPNTAGARSPGCTFQREICEAYPELEACSEGPHFCRFEWFAADGRRFAVITQGEMVGYLGVQ